MGVNLPRGALFIGSLAAAVASVPPRESTTEIVTDPEPERVEGDSRQVRRAKQRQTAKARSRDWRSYDSRFNQS